MTGELWDSPRKGFVALGTVCCRIYSLWGWEAALLLACFRQHPVGVSC